MRDIYYWTVFALACLFVAAVPVVWWVERRADEAMAELWLGQAGATSSDPLFSLAADLARGEFSPLSREQTDAAAAGMLREPVEP